jgi:hypothetical protein
MSFVIEGLSPALFRPYFAESDAALAARNIDVLYAEDPDYPCRVSLAPVKTGERLLLINYEHLPTNSPYRSSHAIFVAEGSTHAGTFHDVVPSPMRSRMLSVRAFDANDRMIDADLVAGENAEALIAQFFANENVVYLHAHYAKRGCFAAKITRV